MPAYLDTSALVKLVVAERESASLREWCERQSELVVSDLSRTELSRAVRRVRPELMPRVRALLDALVLVALTGEILDAAGRLEPPALRSLDAIHLASALALGDDLDAFVTYDERQAQAATAYGLTVVTPG